MVPFSPLNYRLSDQQRGELLGRLGDPFVVGADDSFVAAARAGDAEVAGVPEDVDAPAVVLFTSGTTAAPKAAVLRHRHLTSYVVGTVEFAGADEDRRRVVSVRLSRGRAANLLSNLYAGRRIVYLQQFDAADGSPPSAITASPTPWWCRRCSLASPRCSRPTAADCPAFAPSPTAEPEPPTNVLERVMRLPGVDPPKRYGLTETSSTIAVLALRTRAARHGDPAAVARLSSVGKVLDSIEVEVRDGEIWVRGEQVSGEYDGQAAPLDPDGWFPTRDRGWLDADGYLFIEGRADDTIIRGGENIAPAEIEDALLRHPAVKECAVVGIPDEEWGQQVAAAVVRRPGAEVDEDTLRAFARESLRGSKTPQIIAFVEELPYTETGKLLRRQVQAEFVRGR